MREVSGESSGAVVIQLGERDLSKRVLQLILAGTLLLCLTQCMTHEPSVKDIEGPPSMAATVEKAPTVSWCDLIRESQRYDKQVVRTRALLHVDHENQFLYDEKCETDGATPVWVEFDPSYVYSDEKLKRRLTDIIRPTRARSAGTAAVLVVGRFEGPAGAPFGHLDGYRSRFSIMRLEQVDEVESTATKSN